MTLQDTAAVLQGAAHHLGLSLLDVIRGRRLRSRSIIIIIIITILSLLSARPEIRSTLTALIAALVQRDLFRSFANGNP